MPRKKPAPKKPARTPAKAKPKARKPAAAANPGARRRMALAGAGVALAAGVVVGAGVGVPALGRLAAIRIAHPDHGLQVSLTPPAWMPAATFDELMDRAVAAYAESRRQIGAAEALSAEPLRAVQEAMATSGWAASTPRVTRRRPTTQAGDDAPPRRADVVIEMAWRRPVAVVRSGAFHPGARQGLRDTALDANAAVLPMSGPPETFPDLRVVLNPSRTPQPTGPTDTNPIWPGQDVRDALALLALLGAQPYANQVAGIDLAEHTDGRRLLIVTTTGGRVVWGMPPGAPGFERGEVSDDKKLANLQSLITATGHLDGGQSRVEVHWPGTVLLGDRPQEGAGGR